MQERAPQGLKVQETKHSLRLTWTVKKALAPAIMILCGVGLESIALLSEMWSINAGGGRHTPVLTMLYICMALAGIFLIVVGLRKVRGHGVNELLVNPHGITYTTKFPSTRAVNVPLRTLLYIGGDPLNSQRDLIVFLHRRGTLKAEIYPEFFRYMKYRIEHFIWGKGSRDVHDDWSK